MNVIVVAWVILFDGQHATLCMYAAHAETRPGYLVQENIEGAGFQLPPEDFSAIARLPQTKYFKGDGLGFGQDKPYKSYEQLWDEKLINELQ